MYAVRLVNNIAVQQVRTDAPKPGWITTGDKVALGSTWNGSTFTPPPQLPPKTPSQIEAEVQAALDQLTVSGNQRDKAIVMLVADVIAQSFDLTQQQARAMARDRLQDHLRTLNGI